ncbi:MAG: hypothetical protein VYC95_06070, partial [Verrucomicrobiota bacterium]|nr:hypothetical protein [Verrucomicrobiota bacterium]
FASLAPPSLQEMSIDRLRSVTSEPSLHPQLRKLLDESNDGARTFATLALRRLFPARTEEDLARQLLNHALFDRSEAVRQGASLALRDAGQPGLLVNLVAVLDSPSSSLRTRAVEALGHFGRPASPTVKALVNHLDTLGSRSSSGPRATASFGTQRAFVQGFNSAIAQGSAIGNPDIGVLQTGATIDIRVHGVSSSPATLAAKEAKAIRHSLERITGEKPGTTSSAWIKWWKNRETDR